MKKLLSFFLCMGLFVSGFMPNTVKAEDNVTIKSVTLTQGGETLSLTDDPNTYLTVNDRQVELRIELDNYDPNKNYQLITATYDQNGWDDYLNGCGGQGFYDGVATAWLDLNPDSEISTIYYEISEEFSFTENKKELHVKYHNYDNVNFYNSKLEITEVRQGGQKVDLTFNEGIYFYPLNNVQEVEVDIKGNGFSDNAIYPVKFIDYQPRLVSGAELNAGLTLTNALKNVEEFEELYIESDIFYPNKYPVTQYKVDEATTVETKVERFMFSDPTTEVNVFDFDLEYKDYPNTKIEFDEDWEVHQVSSKYHNADHPLAVTVKGTTYEDRDYNVNITVLQSGNTLYTNTVAMNGLLLNAGAEIPLTGFTLSMENKKYNDEDEYTVKVNLDHVSKEYVFYYGSEAKRATIHPEMFYENGKKNLASFSGDGSYYFGSGNVEFNAAVYEKYENTYFRFLGTDFTDDTTYTYEFGYVTGEDDIDVANLSELSKLTKIDSGTITGKDLNQDGIWCEVKNDKDANWIAYILVVKNGNEIIFWSAPVLMKIDHPVLANVSLKTDDNKDLYLRMDDYSYVATKNSPISATINGVGFDDNETYFGIIDVQIETKDGQFDYDFEELELSGKELNKGKVYKYTGDLTNVKKLSFCVMVDTGEVSAQGYFDVALVESSAYFPKNDKFVIDDAQDIIKNIKGKTNLDEFKTIIGEGNKLEIFDQNGNPTTANYVGTGMKALVTDEYGNALLELDLVVKGDVSGDGQTSITDLVKMEQHLTETKELEGVYEMAGQVNGSDKITNKDLESISNSVVNDEVIE